MKSFIIDTNAMLSFVTDRDPDQQMTMEALFTKAAQLDCKILCHTHVITEFVYVLDTVYRYNKASIRQMILDFLLMPGVETKHDIDFTILMDFWPNSISDFGDGVVASLWAKNRQSSVVTFDKRFIKELEQIAAQVHHGC